MNQTPALPQALARRVTTLVAYFERVRCTRMAGVHLLNGALRVEAVGFRPAPPELSWEGLEGVLITPWFMSLVRLPVQVLPHGQRVGSSQVRDFGAQCFDFLGAHDPSVGYHETCALFSPMEGFAHQDQARDTALAALQLIRQAPAGDGQAQAGVASEAVSKPRPSLLADPFPPSRRAFFGRFLPSAGGKA